nr:hypothetical protein [uncultured Flavobacterium sp.]
MGFFKKIAGGVVKAVNKATGTNMSVGGVGRISNEEQVAALTNTLQQGAELVNNSTGQLLVKDGNKLGDTFKDLGNKLLDGVLNSAADGIVNVVDNKTGQIVNDFNKTNSGQNLNQALGNMGANIANISIKEFLKKHWYWLLLPIGLIFFIVKMFSAPKTKKRVRKR